MTRPEFTPKPTGATLVAGGVRWECWHVGIMQNEYRSTLGTIRRNSTLSAYYAVPPSGEILRNPNTQAAKRFRTFDGAAAALAKLGKKKAGR